MKWNASSSRKLGHSGTSNIGAPGVAQLNPGMPPEAIPKVSNIGRGNAVPKKEEKAPGNARMFWNAMKVKPPAEALVNNQTS